MTVPARDREHRRAREQPSIKQGPTPAHRGQRLQGMLGNRATARVLQRQLMSPSEYLSRIPGSRVSEEVWMDQRAAWGPALGQVAAAIASGHTWLPMRKLDDTKLLDVEKLLGALRGISQISDDRDSYRQTIEAVRWYAGIERKHGASGFATLDLRGPAFKGRPSFPQHTQETVKVMGKQHRRHIFAWHDIREFLWRAREMYRQEVLETIAWLCQNHPAGSSKAIEEGIEHARKQPSQSQEQDLLRVALFVMNGNVRNLWAGSGRINSTLNAVGMSLRKDLADVKDFTGIRELVEKWRRATDGSDPALAAKSLGWQLLNVACEQWAAVKGPTPEKEETHLLRAIRTVNNWVISNLEIDILGESKKTTERVQEQWSGLSRSIATMDSVVQGTAAAEGIEWPQIKEAIIDFMTYQRR
jgi:hypothetical protein